jgi:hypothetical protein
MLISGKLYSCRPNHTADMETKAIFAYISLNVRCEKKCNNLHFSPMCEVVQPTHCLNDEPSLIKSKTF